MSEFKNIYLKKHTFRSQSLILDAQLLADSERHGMVTLAHLCMIIRSAIYSDNLLAKVSPKTVRMIPKSLAEEFEKTCNVKKERIAYQTVIKATTPNSSYLSKQFLQLISFAEDNEKVTVVVLMSEFLRMLKTAETYV